MEWTQLWAGITFAAQNGDAEGLLTAAAAGGLHLSDIVPRPGGFSARCAAWHYRKLAALVRAFCSRSCPHCRMTVRRSRT